MTCYEPDGQLSLPGLEELPTPASPQKKRRQAKSVSELAAIPYLYLDFTPGHVDLLGDHYWKGLTQAQVAEKFHISQQSVSYRESRILQKLKKMMKN